MKLNGPKDDQAAHQMIKPLAEQDTMRPPCPAIAGSLEPFTAVSASMLPGAQEALAVTLPSEDLLAALGSEDRGQVKAEVHSEGRPAKAQPPVKIPCHPILSEDERFRMIDRVQRKLSGVHKLAREAVARFNAASTHEEIEAVREWWRKQDRSPIAQEDHDSQWAAFRDAQKRIADNDHALVDLIPTTTEITEEAERERLSHTQQLENATMNFDPTSPEFHVLRVLGDGDISAAKARELLLEIQAGRNPELPMKIAPPPGHTIGVEEHGPKEAS